MKKNGSAFGTRTLRSDRPLGVAAYERISSSWIGVDLAQPAERVDEDGKNTTIVTMSRRGMLLVVENMLLKIGARAMIGMALRAAASGVTSSLTMRKRLARKAMATPTTRAARSARRARWCR